MKGENTVYYQTGEIAKMNGTTLRTVRLCEEYGIITPVKGENGYRYYTLKEALRIADYLAIRGMGFSVEESKRLMQNGLSPDALPMIQKKLDEVNAQLEKLQGRQRKLREVTEELTFAFQNQGVIFRANVPSYIFSPIVYGRNLLWAGDQNEWYHRWIQALPITNYALAFDITKPADDGDYYSTMGMIVDEAELKQLGLPDHEGCWHMPSQNCLIMYGKAMENENRLDHQVLQALQEYLLAHHLECSGHLFARPLFAEKQGNGLFSLFRYMLPIKEGTEGR